MTARESRGAFRWVRVGPVSLWVALAGCQPSQEGDADDRASTAEAPGEAQAPAQVQVRERAGEEAESDARPQAIAVAPSEPAQADAGGAEPLPGAVAGATFAACFTDGGPYSDCETLYVTVSDTSLGRCVQLTIDNCGTYGRQGLSAQTPARWRLASGSIKAGAEPCEPGVFYPGSASVVEASGSIGWNESTPEPTELVFELSLEPSSVAGSAEPTSLETPEPLAPARCDE